MKNIKQAALLTIKTISNTILGFERGFFRSKYSSETKELFAEINLNVLDSKVEYLIKISTTNYFNHVYDSLVSKDDDYVNDIFDKYNRFTNHSPLCLISILFNYCITAHLTMHRNHFLEKGKLEYLEDYSNSVKKQLDVLFENQLILYIESLFYHECKEEKVVKPLPEGQKFFNFVCVKKCSMCEKETKTKCSRCKEKRYCSAECQRKDWKEHKKLCKKTI